VDGTCHQQATTQENPVTHGRSITRHPASGTCGPSVPLQGRLGSLRQPTVAGSSLRRVNPIPAPTGLSG